MEDILASAENLLKGRFDLESLRKFHHQELHEFQKEQSGINLLSFGNRALARTIVDRILPALHINIERVITKKARFCKLDASEYSSELYGINWTIKEGKIKPLTAEDLKPDAKIVLTANSNLTSPIAFAENMIVAERVAAERHPYSNITVVGFYESGRNFYENGILSFKRMKTLKTASNSLENILPASHRQADLLCELIADGDKKLIREDAAEILSHISLYGYSGCALTNHDAIRLLRDRLENGNFNIRDTPKIRQTNNSDAQRLIPQITLIGFGPADIAQTDTSRIEPKIIYLIGRATDASAAILGKAPFLGKDGEIHSTMQIRTKNINIIDVPTEKKRFGGHDESDYLELYREHLRVHRFKEPDQVSQVR